MKKRIITVILVTITATLSASIGSYANAITASRFDEKDFENCTRIDDGRWIGGFCESEFATAYLSDDDGNGCTVYAVGRNGDEIRIKYKRTSYVAYYRNIRDAVKSVNKNFESISLGGLEEVFKIKNEDGKYTKISIDDVKKVYELIGGEVEAIEFAEGTYEYKYAGFDNLTGYRAKSFKEEKVRDYIADNNINAEINVTKREERKCSGCGDVDEYMEFTIDFNEPLTTLERYEYAKQFYDAAGLTPIGYAPDIPAIQLSDQEKIYDFKNFTNGDANEDGYLTLADSVAILQSIGNPDRYGLSAQGEFNADVDGNAGITGADALVIQQMELGIL